MLKGWACNLKACLLLSVSYSNLAEVGEGSRVEIQLLGD